MNHANKEIRVLLVEDTKIIQTVTRLMLTEFHCHLDIAEYGEKAVELATKNDYDLILMDIDLPDIDGLEATVVRQQY
jgi:CheY-like chemotaxis protein